MNRTTKAVALLIAALAFCGGVSAKAINEPERIFAKQAELTPKTYTVTFKDCQTFSTMLGATGPMRDQGIRKEFIIQSMIMEESLVSPGFKVLLPLSFKVLDMVYSEAELKHHEIETVAFRSCEKYLNKPMVYF